MSSVYTAYISREALRPLGQHCGGDNAVPLMRRSSEKGRRKQRRGGEEGRGGGEVTES